MNRWSAKSRKSAGFTGPVRNRGGGWSWPPSALWLMSRRANRKHLCPRCKTVCNVKYRADDLVIRSQVHRLCVYVSGSLMTVIFCCCTSISVSCLHLGQYSGKFSSTVSFRILSWVLFPQTGHSIHSSDFIVYLPSKRIIIIKYAACDGLGQ